MATLADPVYFVSKLLPYAMALFLALTSLPSRMLKRRHAGALQRSTLTIADRWSSVSEAIGLPLLTLAYAIASALAWKGERISVGALVGIVAAAVVFYVVLFTFSLWTLAANLAQPDKLPCLSVGGRPRVGYDGLLTIVKVAGVLFAAGLDLFVSFFGAGGAAPP